MILQQPPFVALKRIHQNWSTQQPRFSGTEDMSRLRRDRRYGVQALLRCRGLEGV